MVFRVADIIAETFFYAKKNYIIINYRLLEKPNLFLKI